MKIKSKSPKNDDSFNSSNFDFKQRCIRKTIRKTLKKKIIVRDENGNVLTETEEEISETEESIIQIGDIYHNIPMNINNEIIYVDASRCLGTLKGTPNLDKKYIYSENNEVIPESFNQVKKKLDF